MGDPFELKPGRVGTRSGGGAVQDLRRPLIKGSKKNRSRTTLSNFQKTRKKVTGERGRKRKRKLKIKEK